MGKRERRSEKRKKMVMSAILVAIMVVSVGGIFLGQPDTGPSGGQGLSYGDYDFDVINGYYYTEIDRVMVRFNIAPYDVLNINVPMEAMSVLATSPAFVVTFNPNSEDIQTVELSKFQLENNLNKIVYSAVTEESEIYQYPVVNCINATPDFPVLSLVENNETSIVYENGCVIVNAKGVEMLKVVERILYGLLGVIDG